jgi:DNA replication protein DnaC
LERNRQLGLGMTLWSDRRGTGKTMLTTLILKEAMAQGRSVYFSTFPALIDSYSRTWKDPLEASWFRRRVDLADVIALDDMGKESAQTSASIGMIDQFVDRILRGRVSNARITFATSNLDPESTQVGKGFDRYQQDVLELLSEVNEIVEVGGESFRREQQRQKMADFEAGVVYPVVLR